jgi:5-methylcytosine-specific restriction enzyme subunit McrC
MGSTSHLANQLLLAGLRLAARLTQDVHLRATIRLLARTLAVGVSEIALVPDTFDEFERRAHRLVAHYQPAFELIRLLHDGTGASTRDAERRPLQGFLFDMNRFFQRLVYRFLRENLEGYRVDGEHALKGVFRYQRSSGDTTARRNPMPRPDFAVFKGKKPVILLDAKYRDLAIKPLPRDMLYQLAIYSLSRSDCPQSAILYPTMDASAREERIDVLDAVKGDERSRIFLRPIDLNELARVVGGGSATGERGQRMAERLAGVRPAAAVSPHAHGLHAPSQ